MNNIDEIKAEYLRQLEQNEDGQTLTEPITEPEKTFKPKPWYIAVFAGVLLLAAVFVLFRPHYENGEYYKAKYIGNMALKEVTAYNLDGTEAFTIQCDMPRDCDISVKHYEGDVEYFYILFFDPDSGVMKTHMYNQSGVLSSILYDAYNEYRTNSVRIVSNPKGVITLIDGGGSDFYMFEALGVRETSAEQIDNVLQITYSHGDGRIHSVVRQNAKSKNASVLIYEYDLSKTLTCTLQFEVMVDANGRLRILSIEEI